MNDSDPFPPVGYHPSLPPVPLFREGTHPQRVVSALGCFPDGATLDKVAHRADLCLDDVRPAIQSLLRRGLIRFEDVPGYFKRGEWHEGQQLIHLLVRDRSRVGMFSGDVADTASVRG